jgi:hypothetical protein
LWHEHWLEVFGVALNFEIVHQTPPWKKLGFVLPKPATRVAHNVYPRERDSALVQFDNNCGRLNFLFKRQARAP